MNTFNKLEFICKELTGYDYTIAVFIVNYNNKNNVVINDVVYSSILDLKHKIGEYYIDSGTRYNQFLKKSDMLFLNEIYKRIIIILKDNKFETYATNKNYPITSAVNCDILYGTIRDKIDKFQKKCNENK